jgi:hypothetical protein
VVETPPGVGVDLELLGKLPPSTVDAAFEPDGRDPLPPKELFLPPFAGRLALG